MADVDVSVGSGAGVRRRRGAAERRRVVEETLEAGASVAGVAVKHGINANQVFQWRRLYRDGKLVAPDDISSLLPYALLVQFSLSHRYKSSRALHYDLS